MAYTNKLDISLPIQVWLADDDYDYVDDPSYISATTLLKPVRQIILSKRAAEQGLINNDLEDFISSSMGSSIHAAIEKAWGSTRYKENLKKLGMNAKTIEKIRINPEKEEEGTIPIYIEQRATKEINGFKIGGKFDFVLNGDLYDNKSTTAYKWLTGSSDKDYQLQGSIYKWLNPDKIKSFDIKINYVFTDWQKLNAMKDSKYPQHKVLTKSIPLLSTEETEAFIVKKISLIEKYKSAPEKEIPYCSDEDLWRGETKYKYYANPTASKATKNFTTYLGAYSYMMQEKGGKGTIKVVPGEARRCNYCAACALCSQYEELHGSE